MLLFFRGPSSPNWLYSSYSLRQYPYSSQYMTGRKNRTLQVPLVVPYKALEKFSKTLYGTTRDTYSTRFFRPVMLQLLETSETLFTV